MSDKVIKSTNDILIILCNSVKKVITKASDQAIEKEKAVISIYQSLIISGLWPQCSMNVRRSPDLIVVVAVLTSG